MRALALAVAAGLIALPAAAQDAPAISTIGPFEGVGLSDSQIILIDRGSVDRVDGDLRAVILVIAKSDAGPIADLVRVRVDCTTYAMAQMEQTDLDASGNPVSSLFLDNVMTPPNNVGYAIATSACDGKAADSGNDILSVPTLADALAAGASTFGAATGAQP